MKRIISMVIPTILLLAYNNCSSNHESLVTNLTLTSKTGTCDQNLLVDYETDVYPFFRSEATCQRCHVEGGVGLGVFASADMDMSYAAFNAAGLSKVAYMATNPQHQPPHTGAHNQAAVDDFSGKWLVAQKEHLDCVATSQNGGVNESFLTAEKKAPTIYATSKLTETVSWDLDLASDVDSSMTRSLPARVSIDIRVMYQKVGTVDQASGYVFSNPTLVLKDVTKQVIVEGLFFQINGQPISSQTTFTSLSRIVAGPTMISLMNAQANTLLSPMSTQDSFQLYFRRLDLTSGSDTNGPPLTPILRVADTQTGSDALIKSSLASVFIMRDAGIIRWCLSESPLKPASTESPCENTATGPNVLNGWQLNRPTNYAFQSGDGSKRLYLWVANQNLQLNDQAAVYDITLDTVSPAAAAIASITVTDTQVATMEVSHASETDIKGWCTIEQNSTMPVPATPTLADACWTWTNLSAKPTTVGFKSGGTRDVWVYVRDQAGNVSAASNKRTAFNPFGAITFSMLTATTGGAMAIFNNRCLTCHGASTNPGYSKLQLFVYSAAVDVARSGVLISRINNTISPMPNVSGDLMPQRERDLIRLWTLPEGGGETLEQ